MAYSATMQHNLLYSVLLAPRGNVRMANAGMQIAQQYLSPFDRLIGVVGEAGSGKSMLIKGMFPGLELTNDDEGVNVRPLPILDLDDTGFFSPHTYHLDIRFESGFTQMHVLAQAINEAVNRGKRVIVEHFELVYPFLGGRNAHLLIGVGAELIVTRPSFFGPDPASIAEIVFKSIPFRRMSHTAEDLCEWVLKDIEVTRYEHSDVRHGFILSFFERPAFDIAELEHKVNALIEQDLAVCYLDDHHVLIGDHPHPCTGPRNHVKSTGEIVGFKLHHSFLFDSIQNRHYLVGYVGSKTEQQLVHINNFLL